MTDPDRSRPCRHARAAQFVALLVIVAATALRSGRDLQVSRRDRGQRHLALVHRLEPARAGHLRHRRMPLAGRDPGQGLPRSGRGVPGTCGRRGSAERRSTTIRASRRCCPTLIAGLLYRAAASRACRSIGRSIQERAARAGSRSPTRDTPGQVRGVLETPKEPVKWPAYVFYFKPIVVLLNIVPFASSWSSTPGLLDRYAANDWAWFFSLCRRGLRDLAPPFTRPSTTTRSPPSAPSSPSTRSCGSGTTARLRPGGSPRPASSGRSRLQRAAGRGLPGAPRVLLLAAVPRADPALFRPRGRDPVRGVPGDAVPRLGQFQLVYEEFGTEAYQYEGSYWNTPLEMDCVQRPLARSRGGGPAGHRAASPTASTCST